MHTARTLIDTLPATHAALEQGQITLWHALAMVEECVPLDRRTAEQVEKAVLPGAGEKTLAAFRRRLRRAVLQAQPKQAERIHEIAKAERAVRLVPEADGRASFIATLPAMDARAVFLAVDTLARARHQAGGGSKSDPGIDARRADALIALADAALTDRSLPKAHGRRVELQVVIDLASLLGLAENPAELPGYGPLPASVARDLAADATWRRLVTDPVTGHLLDYGHTTYRAPNPSPTTCLLVTAAAPSTAATNLPSIPTSTTRSRSTGPAGARARRTARRAVPAPSPAENQRPLESPAQQRHLDHLAKRGRRRTPHQAPKRTRRMTPARFARASTRAT